MTEFNSPESSSHEERTAPSWGPWLLGIGCFLVMLIGLLLTWRSTGGNGTAGSTPSPGTRSSIPASRGGNLVSARLAAGSSGSAPEASAAQVVARKVTQFGRSRRDLASALARGANVQMPEAVRLFFDAVEAGDWDEIEARFKALDGAPNASNRLPEVKAMWAPILETFGVAEAAHLWPAQKLLDYGNAILDSLRPGMVYVGGTDSGRFIPTLLNETNDGERHVVITQNALADSTYADYIRFQYADQLPIFTPEDSQKAFQDYIADAQKRLAHDQQFPDEPKQVLPGETLTNSDGRFTVSGQTAVMAINERLLQTILQKNPDVPFALEESFPLKSTYADAAPLGPIMELRAQDASAALSADSAAQSVDYWRSTTRQLLDDPEASGSPETLKTYSHMAGAQANLLAERNDSAHAEQTYRLASDLWPGNPEAVSGLAAVLNRTGRADQGQQLVNEFLRQYPDQREALGRLSGWRLVGPAQSGSPPGQAAP